MKSKVKNMNSIKKYTKIILILFFNTVLSAQTEKTLSFTSIKLPERKKTFAEFFTGREYKYECGIFDFSAENQVGILKQNEGTVYFNTELKMAGFEADYYSQIYYIYMNDSARKILAENVEKYIEDFEKRNLKTKRKNYKVYGELQIRLEWGSVPSMTDSYGKGQLQCGYRFYKNSPYFTLTVWPVKNLETRKAAATSKSVRIQYYFTKAQAKKLAELLSDENLSEVLKPFIIETEEDSENEKKGTKIPGSADKPLADEY